MNTEEQQRVDARFSEATQRIRELGDAGDKMLEALIRCGIGSTMLREWPAQGDLVIETTSLEPDWERVGYLLSSPTADPLRIWSITGRETRWHNAAVMRLGRRGARLRQLSFPSAIIVYGYDPIALGC